MELMGGVHLVGSGYLGFNLTDPHDCHTYLVEAGANEAILIDAGCGLAPERIIREIERSIGDPRKVGTILLTHAHPDHSGGAAELSDALGAQVWGSGVSAAALEAADEVRTGLASARAAGVYPPHMALRATRVARHLGGETLRFGRVAIEALPTPGHAADHMVYVTRLADLTIAFSGDLIFARGRVAVLGTPDSCVPHYRDSVATLAQQEPDVLLPGHGEVVLDDAMSHIVPALDQLSNHALPPQLVS